MSTAAQVSPCGRVMSNAAHSHAQTSSTKPAHHRGAAHKQTWPAASTRTGQHILHGTMCRCICHCLSLAAAARAALRLRPEAGSSSPRRTLPAQRDVHAPQQLCTQLCACYTAEHTTFLHQLLCQSAAVSWCMRWNWGGTSHKLNHHETLGAQPHPKHMHCI